MLDIKSKIYTIRWKQVMLDKDLAELYGVETKVFNQAVNRNIERFPKHFRFQLTKDEYEILRSQFVTSRLESKNQINVKQHWWNRYLPYVFTEQGVSMLSAVLRSKIAIEISIKIIDSFISMRNFISQNSLIFQKFEQIDKKLFKNDEKFDKIFQALENKNHIQEQGIFYNGQIFDAYSFVSDLIRSAKKTIILIDNYVDDTTLTLLSKNKKVNTTIYTDNISKTLEQDLIKYNKQYKQLQVKITKKFHDRFLILDKKEIYLIGASLKDLAKKVFWFSKINTYKDLVLEELEF